jgi:transcriptional regulator with XRE-family HTH domain
MQPEENRQSVLVKDLVAYFTTLRKERGWSQRALAELVGTTQSAVSDFEAGAIQPKMATLQRYARALGFELEIKVMSRKTDNVHYRTRERGRDDE